jgi:DNA-binding MurR/RpiR family transcriptional regulator
LPADFAPWNISFVPADQLIAERLRQLVPALAVVEALIAAAVRQLGDAPRARIAAYDAYWAQRHGIGAVPPQAIRTPSDPLPVRNPAS